MSVAHAADDIPASARGWRCFAMLVAPVLVFGSIMAAPLPQVGGQFEPARLTWWGSFAVWFLYAAALVRLVESYRLAKGGTFGAQRKRRGVSSFGDVLIIGGFAWIWLSVMTAGVLAGSINEEFGSRCRSAEPLRNANGTATHATKLRPTVTTAKARRVAGTQTNTRQRTELLVLPKVP